MIEEIYDMLTIVFNTAILNMFATRPSSIIQRNQHILACDAKRPEVAEMYAYDDAISLVEIEMPRVRLFGCHHERYALEHM